MIEYAGKSLEGRLAETEAALAGAQSKAEHLQREMNALLCEMDKLRYERQALKAELYDYITDRGGILEEH